jgi:predicted RNase H-like nuclease
MRFLGVGLAWSLRNTSAGAARCHIFGDPTTGYIVVPVSEIKT